MIKKIDIKKIDIKEIDIIMNLQINTNAYLNNLIKKFKKELDGFIYASTINEIIGMKKIYIRYISIKGQFGYGGFYNKVIETDGQFYILLINSNKKIWEVSFNNNFIFYKKINTNDDDKRNLFNNFLQKYDK